MYTMMYTSLKHQMSVCCDHIRCCIPVQGVKLYYAVLEAMLIAEEGRTQQSNFTSLLSSNSFHKCLAGCAFELVVAAYKMVSRNTSQQPAC